MKYLWDFFISDIAVNSLCEIEIVIAQVVNKKGEWEKIINNIRWEKASEGEGSFLVKMSEEGIGS